MSQFQEKINKLKPYVIGIRFIEASIIIDVIFKDGWSPAASNKINAKKSPESNVNYYMIYSEDEAIILDDLLQYVEHTITLNIEREKKTELFKKKVKDMEELFKNTSLTELENMKFNLNEPNFEPELFTPDFSEPMGVINMEEKVEAIEPTEPTNNDDDEFEEKEIPYQSPQEMMDAIKEKNSKLALKQKTMDFDLPPKPNEKIVIEDFKQINSICKCGPGEMCEACI